MDDGRSFLNDRVIVKVGDITKESVDAIVNAANGTLMGGGGVDGAIHRAGGPEILAACKEIRREPAKHVIHTVGPVYDRGGQDKAELLAACYSNSLSLVVQNCLQTVAFPAISTGVYGYPISEAAVVASRAIEQFLRDDKTLKEVRLVFFGSDDAEVFLNHNVFSR